MYLENVFEKSLRFLVDKGEKRITVVAKPNVSMSKHPKRVIASFLHGCVASRLPVPRKFAFSVSLPAWAGDIAGFCLSLLTQDIGKQTSLFSLWPQPVVPQLSEIFTPWGSCQLLGQGNMELGTFSLCSTSTQPRRSVCVQFSTGHSALLL